MPDRLKTGVQINRKRELEESIENITKEISKLKLEQRERKENKI